MATSNDDEFENYPMFTCPICFSIFIKPIALSCGHTFCRDCLKESLRLQSKCPNCRMPCPNVAYQNSENLAISQFLASKFPDYYSSNIDSRASSNCTDQNPAPVLWNGHLFKLNYILFPYQKGSLLLYEERYKALAIRALNADCKFVIHPTGSQNTEGIQARIESYEYIGENIHISIVGEKKCKFLADASPLNEEEFRLNLSSANVELIVDSDVNESEMYLGDDLQYFQFLKQIIPLLLHHIRQDQLRIIHEIAGDIPNESQWQRWILWLSCTMRMTKDDRKRLFLAESSKRRFQILKMIIMENAKLLHEFILSLHLVVIYHQPATQTTHTPINNISTQLNHNSDNINDHNVSSSSSPSSSTQITNIIQEQFNQLPGSQKRGMAEEGFEGGWMTMGSEKSIWPSVFLLVGILFYLLIYFKFPLFFGMIKSNEFYY